MASPSIHADSPTEESRYRALIAGLRDRRRLLGMSQLDLELNIGLCSGHVDKWERLVRRPTAWNLSNWCLALGLVLCAMEQ